MLRTGSGGYSGLVLEPFVIKKPTLESPLSLVFNAVLYVKLTADC